ncbi:MAG: hypothetical protein JWO16_1832, partial [Sphingomonas bacterium]|nr:hypothetical protein [Sphingomonas bacterium]
MAGTPSSGALTLRAGEPFVAHFTLHDNLGVPQSLAGRTFSLAVVKVGATSSFMDAEATLSGDNLYAILSFTGDQTAAAFVEFGARIVTYALLEQIDDAQVTRATNSLTVQASTAEPSASDPVIIDIPYVNAFVSPQGFVVATTGSDSTTAKAATAGDRVQTDLDVIATGEIRDETAGIRDATQAIADIVATDAATVAGDRDTTEGYRDEALASANLAADALASILMSANRYPDYATGFAATTSGQYFLVMAPDANTFAVLYRNPSATPLTSFPSASALAAAILALNSRTVDSRILRSIADLHQSGKGYVAKSDIASVPEAIAGLISGKWIDPVALKASIEAAIASLGTRSPDPRILRAIADLRRAQANVAEAATPPVSPSALGRILYPVHRELLDLLERVESLEASGGGGAGAGLPSFPTPRMAIVGNSLTRQNDSNDTNDKRNIGYSYWAMLRCGYRVASPGTLNFGVNGERSDEILARYSAVLAAEPGVIVLHSITTNDVKYPGLTKEQSLANVTSMVDQALAAYIPVIITTDVPRGNAAFPSQRYNSDQQAKSNWLRRQVMLLGARQGVTVIDGYRLTVDPASTTADAIANTKSDGLHSLHLEAKRYGDLIGDALAQIFPPWPRLPATNTDLYDATS